MEKSWLCCSLGLLSVIERQQSIRKDPIIGGFTDPTVLSVDVDNRHLDVGRSISEPWLASVELTWNSIPTWLGVAIMLKRLRPVIDAWWSIVERPIIDECCQRTKGRPQYISEEHFVIEYGRLLVGYASMSCAELMWSQQWIRFDFRSERVDCALAKGGYGCGSLSSADYPRLGVLKYLRNMLWCN